MRDGRQMLYTVVKGLGSDAGELVRGGSEGEERMIEVQTWGRVGIQKCLGLERQGKYHRLVEFLF